ncbi:MAG: hypothetical protein HRT35_29105 [Algicola sp.]|nr:hypothetical protein [Algicola sp.]
MNETEVDETHQEEAQPGQTNGIREMTMWIMVLSIYIFLLSSIGYIAFWDQDFNKAENTVGSYVKILTAFEQKEQQTGQQLSAGDTGMIIQEMMKKGADSAGDLQELASQSFNIVLGAILAFLSASATMVFQQVNNIRPKNDRKTDTKTNKTGKSDDQA